MSTNRLLSVSSVILKRVGLPLFLFLILIVPLYIGPFVSVQAKAVLYSISLTIKEILLFILPLIIFSFIFAALLNLKSGVLRFIITLVCMIFISNCLAIFTGFTVGSLTLTKLTIPAHVPVDPNTALNAVWTLKLPKWIGNQYALIIGFVLGIFFSFKHNHTADKVAKKMHFYAISFLKKIFIPLLPIFILGFVFKLEHDHLLARALKTYGPVCLIVVSTQICYMLFLYFVVAKFSFKCFLNYLKNVVPATITGLSTVSSAATMPLLILCTEKNLKDPEVAEMVIPATINTHTLGSALGITILSLTTLLAFGHQLPSLAEFMEFGFSYALAKFAVAAVPGGAIIVATPILEHYLHFTSEMSGLMTAIYMLFDPFGTATNVTGNGVFPIAFSKIYKFNKIEETQNEDVEVV